jgi:hypothetical protein
MKYFEQCPLGHECTSDCQKTKECPCNEHEHFKAWIGAILWKINKKFAFWFLENTKSLFRKGRIKEYVKKSR